MDAIYASNVSEGLAQGLMLLHHQGIPEPSRNGPVLVAPGPVVTIYSHPERRVLFSNRRNANPFFHLFEALWMLGGSNQLAFPAQFAKNILNYSDDGGKTQWGAYGWRWRSFFGWDQLDAVVNELSSNPKSRRVVVSMWNASMEVDVPGWEVNAGTHPGHGDYETSCDFDIAIHGGRDVPCNTHIYFDARGERLNMTVLNRSNDIWWGTYGANAVHMSILQEYLANRIGIPVGEYRQFSNNFHLYTEVLPGGEIPSVAADVLDNQGYDPVPVHFPLGAVSKDWDHYLQKFLANPEESVPPSVDVPFFSRAARPAYQLWLAHKRKAEPPELMSLAFQIAADDWRVAMLQWTINRYSERQLREKAGQS